MKRLAASAVIVAALAATAHADDDSPTEQALDAAYDRVTARPHPRYLLPAIESASLIGLGAVWYWLDRERQVADWDFPSWKDRVTLAAWRFDNNPFPINFAWHAIDGGQYHLLARDSDLALLPSIGYGLATSFAWEYLLEFREKVSINDVIVTTGAGTAFGEFFHWLGVYLESAPDPRAWHPFARWFLTTTRTAHAELLGRDTLRAGTTDDNLGLSSDIWHRFHTAVGFERADAGGEPMGLVHLAADGELAVLPGYLTAPVLTRRFADGNLTRLDARLTQGGDAFGLELDADAMLLGYHHQRLPSATTVGLSLAYHYQRELYDGYVERIAQMHLPGLGLDQHWIGDRVSGHLRARVHGDFAGLHAVGYPAWKDAHPDAVEKTILRKHGYYYGWGVSGSLEAEVELPRVTLGGAIEIATYASQEGLDRTQEDVTDDVELADDLVRWDAWARVTPIGRMFVGVRAEGTSRDGHVGEIAASQSLQQYSLELGATW